MRTTSGAGPATCPRCGEPVPRKAGRGRPARWCSQRCRRAAYEARRAAREGAAGVELVRVEIAPPPRPEDAAAVTLRSPEACREVLRGLREVAAGGGLSLDPEWSGVRSDLERILEADKNSGYYF